MAERVIGESWAQRGVGATQALMDSSVTRPACPICGHPTNDCTGHNSPTPTSKGQRQ